MIPLDKAVVARLTSHSHKFEILVDADKASEAKEKNIPVDDWVAAREIYRDWSKAEKASEDTLKIAFDTTDFDTVAKAIIEKGEIQLTTEKRRQILADKKKQVIDVIAKNAINPRTKLPHPTARIEKAMEEAKVHIDPFKSVSRQVDEVVNKLRPILPIKFAVVRVEIRIPASHAAKLYGYLHELKRIKEEWKDDGSLVVVAEMPAGMQTEVYDKLNSATHGSVTTKLLETI